jgi:uncharacterized protein
VTFLRLAREGAFRIVLSETVFGELHRTLDKPYFARSVPAERRDRAIAMLREVAETIPVPETAARIATHPEDDLILAAAAAAGVDCLVTGDRQLLALGDYGGVRIISPTAFLTLLDAAEPPHRG